MSKILFGKVYHCLLYTLPESIFDQKKIAKCLTKLPKNDFTWKITDFDTFTKIA